MAPPPPEVSPKRIDSLFLAITFPDPPHSPLQILLSFSQAFPESCQPLAFPTLYIYEYPNICSMHKFYSALLFHFSQVLH